MESTATQERAVIGLCQTCKNGMRMDATHFWCDMGNYPSINKDECMFYKSIEKEQGQDDERML